MNYIANVGLEVHVQLKTKTKIFCGCPTTFGAPPNTHVCPVCLGYPGAMPSMNSEAIRLTVLSGLMLGCRINAFSKMDRKNYYYPDMPKNYQISQYDQPLCLGGGIEIALADGSKKRLDAHASVKHGRGFGSLVKKPWQAKPPAPPGRARA